VTVKPRRRWRVCLAVYGPATTGLLGLILLVGGVFGITRAQLVDPAQKGPGHPAAAIVTFRPR
jgi:hypothetical protein